MSSSIYQIEVTTITGKTITMEEFKGKTLLIVNTASKCGLTPQYKGLEELYQKYKDKGLVVLGFPCNQFGHQEPGSESDIQSFCEMNYGVSFPMFAKIDVNGDNTHPLFHYLKESLDNGLLGSTIKWNFTKFLVDKTGKPIDRFAPTTEPESLEKSILKIL